MTVKTDPFIERRFVPKHIERGRRLLALLHTRFPGHTDTELLMFALLDAEIDLDDQCRDVESAMKYDE